jgi:hypothetical protein
MPAGTTSRRGRLAVAGRRQAQQVLRRGRVEPEHAGQRLENLRRRVAVAPLLEPQVVVGADAGQGRDLLAAQAGRPPDAQDAEPRGRGVDELTTRAQILA